MHKLVSSVSLVLLALLWCERGMGESERRPPERERRVRERDTRQSEGRTSERATSTERERLDERTAAPGRDATRVPERDGARQRTPETVASETPPRVPAETVDSLRRGRELHEELRQLQRPSEGQRYRDAWILEAVERKMGGQGRVDELWINHEQKRIVVIDMYTGRVESPQHRKKGWDYAQEPKIKQYIDRGYRYDYRVGINHPDALQ